MKLTLKTRLQSFYGSLSFDHKFSFWSILTTFLSIILSAALSMLIIDNSVNVQAKLARIEYTDKILPSYIKLMNRYSPTFYDIQDLLTQDGAKNQIAMEYFFKNKDEIISSAEYLVDSVMSRYIYYSMNAKDATKIKDNNGEILLFSKILKLSSDSNIYTPQQIVDSIAMLVKSPRYAISSNLKSNTNTIAAIGEKEYRSLRSAFEMLSSLYSDSSALYEKGNEELYKIVNDLTSKYPIINNYFIELIKCSTENLNIISKDLSATNSRFTINVRVLAYLFVLLVIIFIIFNILIRLIVNPYKTVNNKEYDDLLEKYNRLKNENLVLSNIIDSSDKKFQYNGTD